MTLYTILYITYIVAAVVVAGSLIRSGRQRRETVWKASLPMGAVIGTGWPIGWLAYGLMEVKLTEMGGIYWVAGVFMVPVFYVITVVAVTMAAAAILRFRRNGPEHKS